MAQYIDKSALVAEIKRQISAIDDCPKITNTQISVLAGNKVVLIKLLSFIDTLEVKEVQEEPVISVWHDGNILPIKDDKHLWVVVSFKNGDIYTGSITTLRRWQEVQGDEIDCWAYKEDLLKL